VPEISVAAVCRVARLSSPLAVPFRRARQNFGVFFFVGVQSCDHALRLLGLLAVASKEFHPHAHFRVRDQHRAGGADVGSAS